VLTALFSPPLDRGNADFEPSNLEVTTVDVGNAAHNVIPGEVRLAFNVRFNDLWTPESLKAEIARRVAAAAGGARTTLAFEPTNAVAFLTKPGPFTDLVAAAVEDVTGRKPTLSTGGGATDARFIKNACPVVELGLVNATIHAVDERVPLDDLEALSQIYERALDRYFAEFGSLARA
jgi:succinyl-diaminopimelate desuccinylase